MCPLSSSKELLAKLKEDREFLLYEIEAVNEAINAIKNQQDKRQKQLIILDERIDLMQDIVNEIMKANKEG